jgi:histone acetyltransferase (RNA polymerase elongator complex component)
MAKEAIDSCQLIKSRGFKLGIQLMPGLPKDTHQNWNQTVQITLKLRPDFIRIYPTLVLKGTGLEREYIEGRYKPLSLARAVVLASKAYLTFTEAGLKVIKMGLHSDVSYEKDQVVAGPYHPAFAELVSRHVLYRRIIDNYTPGFTVRLSGKDRSLVYGSTGCMYRKLERKLGISLARIQIDEGLERLAVQIEER